METFLACCGAALIILALGFFFNGMPHFINIEHNYYNGTADEETDETE